MKTHDIKIKLETLIDQKKYDLIGLCSDLIKIPSENPPGKMKEITQFILKYLEEGNIACEVVQGEEGFPNIVATMGTGTGPLIIFNGHSDVVPAGDRSGWDFDPFGGEVTNTKILGRGTSDMKCGLGGVLFIMRLLSKKNIYFNGKIALHVVPDEESGGQMGTRWLVENGYADNGSYCIVAEPTSYNNCEVGQKGSLHIKIKSQGIPAHGSIGNYVGKNAILKIVKILTHVEELRNIKGIFSKNQQEVLKDSKIICAKTLKAKGVENVIDHVTVNVGTIKGGTKINMVPDYCEAEIDIRIPIGLKTQFVIDEFNKIVNGLNMDGIDYEYSWNSEANFTDTNSKLVKSAVENAERVWDKKVVPAYQWASSDARYYRYKNIPTIQYGPANIEGIHSYNETVDIQDVVNAVKVYSGILVDLLDIQQ